MGVHSTRRSVTGQPLPYSRSLSHVFFPNRKIDDHQLTLLAMQWGQIIAHDLSFALDSTPDLGAPACCDSSGPLLQNQWKGEPCYPILIEPDDPFVIKYGQKCMDYVRTTTAKNECRGTPLEPLSEVTHWMDGSTIYGNYDALSRELRQHQGGLLRVDLRHGQKWPPPDIINVVSCVKSAPEGICYKTGDPRVNQNPQLAQLQIILLREHNRVATTLGGMNRHWDDERTYQEARRIVIAEIQHISYYEWLPNFISVRKLEEARVLYTSYGSYVDGYNPEVNPSVFSEHAQGAFRFFHALIQGQLSLFSDNRCSRGSIPLTTYFNNASILEDGNFENLARGLTTQAKRVFSRYHDHAVTENFARRPENPAVGFDIKSIDLHRGRDHGIGTYNDYRVKCGLKKAHDFQYFDDLITQEDINLLKKHYEDPDDVDLGIGGALEISKKGEELLGPTFTCILLQQFHRTRTADRFFFEHGNHEAAFTLRQLKEIRRSSVARLMCDNVDGITTMQPKAFAQLSQQNGLVSCADSAAIPRVNLQAWKEGPAAQ